MHFLALARLFSPVRAVWAWVTADATRMGFAALIALCAVLGWRVAAIDGDRDKWRDLAKAEKAAHAATVDLYQAAAKVAERVQQENIERVRAETEANNAQALSDYNRRIADLRMRAKAKADPGSPRQAGVSSLPVAPGGVVEAACPVADALIANEQAVQLDELISWVERQASVETSPAVPQ